MTEQELDKVAEELYNKMPLGYEMAPEPSIFKDGFKAGYNAALAGYDPFKEYFEKDGEEEIIDEDFSV